MNLNAIASLRANKSAISLPQAEQDRLFAFLQAQFGMAQPPERFDLATTIRAACGARVADEYDRLNALRATGSPARYEAATRAFYELAGAQPLMGLVHSTKWALISDAGAYLSALVRDLDITGPVLDVGCNAGYHALWLATHHGVPVRGVDRSRAAIGYARESAKRLGISPAAAAFDGRALSDACPSGGYDLVYSSDGPLALTTATLIDLGPLVADGGIFVWFGDDLSADPDSLRQTLTDSGFGFELADVTGGWTGERFESKAVLVLSKGGIHPVPNDLAEEIESVWNSGFPAYCNAPDRAPTAKTLSQFRSFCHFPTPAE